MEYWIDYLAAQNWPVLGKLFVTYGVIIMSPVVLGDIYERITGKYPPR